MLNDFDLSAKYGHRVGAMEAIRRRTSDGTIDIDFLHGIPENPLVNAIEILTVSGNPSTLSAPPVAFGSVPAGSFADATATLTHAGAPTDPALTISAVGVSGTDSDQFSLVTPFAPVILFPGDSTTVALRFEPTSAGAKVAQLDVTHNGTGSPVVVGLSGTGDVPIPTNSAPTCTDDSATATNGVPLIDSVTCDDVDLGDTLTYAVVDDVDNGTLNLNTTDGTFTYTSSGGFVGTDTFTFTANDGDVDSNTATFTIDVEWAAGTILYRVNAGGPTVAAVDSGPAWAVDTDGSPSPLHNAGTTAGDWGTPDERRRHACRRRRPVRSSIRTVDFGSPGDILPMTCMGLPGPRRYRRSS